MKTKRITQEKTLQVTGSTVSAARVQACRDSLLLRLRALGTIASVLAMSDNELLAAMSHDEGLQMYIEVLKLQHHDIGFEKFQTEIRQLAMDRVSTALVEIGHPNTKAMILAPLDLDALPPMPAFSALEINSVHPLRISQMMERGC